MKVTLVQDEIYLPSLGGGTKANRYLLEELASVGHHCVALTRACTRSPDGPNTRDLFVKELESRGLAVQEIRPNVFCYPFGGVQVEALDHDELDERRAECTERIRASEPDWVFVADDKRRFMLQSALEAAPDQVILLLQTVVQLPFGPLSQNKSREYTRLMARARSIVAISEFERDYIRSHSDLEAVLLHIPVYGKGPFPNLANPTTGFVTMINPCELKGLTIFVALARRFPEVAFAAVPTWGSSEQVLRTLRQLPNVTILDRSDDIDQILVSTRVLLVPSLWPETFGYVAPEAMLRGIPVLASRIGGLPEAKLGVDYLLDVAPGEWNDGQFVVPPQNVDAWSSALAELIFDIATYRRCSEQSRQAAERFVNGISVKPFESLLRNLSNSASNNTLHDPALPDLHTARPPASHASRHETLHPEFVTHLQQQPYTVILDGFTLDVDEDVFPPDLGLCAQNMARLCQLYAARSALDMGCGSGYLALSLQRSGVPEVWASDIHLPAVRCAAKNVDRNGSAGSIRVLQSDLFDGLPANVTFDLIVFNQPFGPAATEPVCGCGTDGGYEITKRFLLAAPAYLNPKGVLLMAFSDREPSRHSPDQVARELGYPVKTLLHKYYGGANNYVFEIRCPVVT